MKGIFLKHTAKVLWTMALLIFLAAACEGIGTTPIGNILDKPRDYAGKKVTVSGEVTEIFSLFVIKYFVVQDKTGRIAVVSDKPLPRKGNTVRVAGTVREAFSIGDQQLLVLVEEGTK
ncbi:exported hypothetical protein [Syntrophobacter sp. SbD1]|nr:exported hypothetical protein [Syntrophobacter sp. SbD1]